MFQTTNQALCSDLGFEVWLFEAKMSAVAENGS